MENAGADAAAEFLHNEIQAAAIEFIPKRILLENKSTHPWINEKVVDLVKRKQDAENTPQASAARDACSAGMKEEYVKYVNREKAALQGATKALKGWWSKTGRLLRQRARTSTLPAPRNVSGEWVLGAKGKSNLFADSFQDKLVIPAAAVNQYTKLERRTLKVMKKPFTITEQMAEKSLRELDVNSATGPDQIPARVLNECAKSLRNQ